MILVTHGDRLEWIVDQPRFAAVAADWDAIAAHGRTPFVSSAWIQAWCDAFAEPDRVRIATLWRGETLVAGVPLLAGRGHWNATANDHTPEFDVVAADDAARESLIDQVVRESSALNLPRLADEGPVVGELQSAGRRLSRWSLTEEGNTALVTHTTDEVDRYRAGLSSKVRSEVGRLRRKSAREHELEVVALAEPHDLENQLTRAFAVEASGWKGRAGTAISASPKTERFYRQVARASHARGSLRLSELSLDGELAAMAITLIHQRRAWTLKVGYDERHRRLGPGLVLLTAMIEQCFALGLEAYEFCGPQEDYERRFATAQRTYRQVKLYRPGLLNAGRYVHYRQIRPMLRRGYHELRRRRGN